MIEKGKFQAAKFALRRAIKTLQETAKRQDVQNKAAENLQVMETMKGMLDNIDENELSQREANLSAEVRQESLRAQAENQALQKKLQDSQLEAQIVNQVMQLRNVNPNAALTQVYEIFHKKFPDLKENSMTGKVFENFGLDRQKMRKMKLAIQTNDRFAKLKEENPEMDLQELIEKTTEKTMENIAAQPQDYITKLRQKLQADKIIEYLEKKHSNVEEQPRVLKRSFPERDDYKDDQVVPQLKKPRTDDSRGLSR